MTTPTSALDILKGARALLSDPAKWTKGSMAVDADGCQVSVDSYEATCFCALGAIEIVGREASSFFLDEANVALSDLVRSRGYGSVGAGWNDKPETTHDDVLSMFDDAISSLERGAA